MMSCSLVQSAYGKSRVRLTKVTRLADRHLLKEIAVDIQLEGAFDRSYTDGDNSNIVATDTMKNTVYALASSDPIENIETFAKNLGNHFVTKYKQIALATISIEEELWQRIPTAQGPHRHAFTGGSNEKRVTNIECTRESVTVESGIEGLSVLKTTDSEFHGFVRDEYTTLADTNDRIFATNIMVHWLLKSPDADFDKVYENIREICLDVFATHHSLAVQETLFQIGKVALEKCDSVEQITVTMPNQHRIPVDLTRFGLQNKNEIFVPTDEPFGLISATVGRGVAQPNQAKLAAGSSKSN